MKRKGNLFAEAFSLENLYQAELNARKGKEDQYGVSVFDRNKDSNISELRDMIWYKEYTTSPYLIRQINDPKERDIYILPYYPDRIVHHAVMIPLRNVIESTFTADTYSGIKGRGIHQAHHNIRKALRNVPGTKYCLKIDIKKFYPNVDHDILKTLIRRKIKDPDMLWILDDIIDSAEGLPIGNYLSQCFANFYITPLDHYIKEVLRVQNYFRYMDDMAFFSGSKEYLHQILTKVRVFLSEKLKLTIKYNYQIFPVADQGLDMLGYVYYDHDYILIRKTIKKRFAKAVANGASWQVIASYLGWAKYAKSNNLLKKILYESSNQIQGPPDISGHLRLYREKNQHRRCA